jgi:WD40 repeat protein
MVAALEENERSATFDGDLASTADVAGLDDPASVSIVPMHALSPYDPDAAASNDDADANAFPWRDLVPTGVSWNCSGYSLAVSYGRFDVTGWCDSPGALCVWNLRRADVDPRRPHVTLETSSCLQCVAFHPTDPSFIAAGSLDGEVMVWDLSRDDKENAGDVRNATKTVGDALVGKSEVSDASHREPVTSVHWSYNPELATSSSSTGTGGYVDGHELVSTGGDGRVLVWCPGSMARPVFGYELRAQRGRDGGAMTAWGAASASFMTSGPAPGRDKKRGTEGQTGSFLVGSDGGPVFRCLTRHTRGMTTEFHAKCTDNESDTPAMYSPIKQEYDGHAGSVHSVAVNPHDTRVFSTCGSDGAMRVYTKMYKRSLLELSPLDGALFATQWSPTRPGTLACGGVGGRVCLYDLTVTGGEDVQPTAQFRACDRGTNVQGVAFNPVLPEYLATADGFAVRVWELGLGLTTPRSNEGGFIDAVAERGDGGGGVRGARRRQGVEAMTAVRRRLDDREQLRCISVKTTKVTNTTSITAPFSVLEASYPESGGGDLDPGRPPPDAFAANFSMRALSSSATSWLSASTPKSSAPPLGLGCPA